MEAEKPVEEFVQQDEPKPPPVEPEKSPQPELVQKPKSSPAPGKRGPGRPPRPKALSPSGTPPVKPTGRPRGRPPTKPGQPLPLEDATNPTKPPQMNRASSVIKSTGQAPGLPEKMSPKRESPLPLLASNGGGESKMALATDKGDGDVSASSPQRNSTETETMDIDEIADCDIPANSLQSSDTENQAPLEEGKISAVDHTASSAPVSKVHLHQNGTSHNNNTSIAAVTEQQRREEGTEERHYWRPPVANKPLVDQIFITDVTSNKVTVTVRECATETGFFRERLEGGVGGE